ncbi:60S ribosomal export protein NMD3 [Haladaptatus sp. CMSO5]|uniref:60S ribosomal export protein NMD3 n=1 Tax=Haladaptatus sp. CMSO5 TaxID=3120514 RepID=UPI002FCE2E24
MTDSRAFCPRCGETMAPPEEPRPGEPVDPDAKLCDACYFENFEFVSAPDRIEVLVCAHCGALHRKSSWVDVGADDYTDIAIEEVSRHLQVHIDVEDVNWVVEPEQVDQNTIRMHCYFTGVIRDTPVEEEVMVPVKISRQTCSRCGKIAGSYYASTVQIRGRNRTPTAEEMNRAEEIANEVVASMQETGDREAFITETKRSDDGLNVKVSTNKIGMKIARRVVNEFGGSYSDSETLVTEDEDGNGVYRVTFAVRLPPFTPGDVIDPDDDAGPVLVKSVQGHLKGIRLTTGEPFEAPFGDEEAASAKKVGSADDAEETTLVTVEDEHAVQVLDPETFESKTISRPSYLDPDATMVPVLKSRAGLHILPDDA